MGADGSGRQRRALRRVWLLGPLDFSGRSDFPGRSDFAGHSEGSSEGTSDVPTHAGLAAPKVTWAEHGDRFVAAVENGPLCATQFHPEKSGDAGAVLLRNWLDGLR